MKSDDSSIQPYDAIIIGTGQGGKPLALELAKAGRRTAVIERDKVGGTCINRGCTPTKTMVASARTAYLVRRASEYGVHVGETTVNLGEIRRRKDDIVESFRSSAQKGLEETANLSLIFGAASFESARVVRVERPMGDTMRLSAPTIVINTGCRPASGGLPGVETIGALDSTTIMELDDLPNHLLVLGGGYIGLEFGQMFRRFGSRVTIVQRGNQLLGKEDPDVAAEVAAILRQEGVDVLLGTRALEAAKTRGGVRLRVKTPEGERTLDGSHLLMAAGRVPNTENLRLDAAGVTTDAKGYVSVDEKLQTNVSGVYALGDVNGGPAFTHISYDDFRILRTNLLGNGQATTRGRLVPYAVFIDPQLGRVGLSETEAREQGRPVRIARLPMTSVARAIEMGETRGFMKAIIDESSGQILGCAILSFEGGELMSMMEIAIMGKVPCTALRDAIFAHPTLAESLNSLFTES